MQRFVSRFFNFILRQEDRLYSWWEIVGLILSVGFVIAMIGVAIAEKMLNTSE